MLSGQLAHVLDCEAQDIAFLINALHDGIFTGLAHNPRRIRKEDLKEVPLRIEPDFYSGLCHIAKAYFIPPCVIVYPITNTAARAAIDTQIATTSRVVKRMFCR